jgi:catechol 2,3-dioxygenase-like lactoylglutathione lyase family enzyme
MTFGFGKTFHLIHIADDFEKAARWYADVFDGLAGWVRYPGFPYLEVEIRDADLIIIADCCVEPMAPAKRVEGWDSVPVGRFLNKFGPRWQTMSWYTDGLPALYDHLKARNTRFFELGGASGDGGLGKRHAIFTHPRDTFGGLEFVSFRSDEPPARPPTGDPRFYPGFDPQWWYRHHPLQLERLGHMTVVVDDLDAARDFYVNGLNATPLTETASELTGTRSRFFAVGTDTVVEVAKPVTSDSLAAHDLARNGPIFHAVTWTVRDLAAARAHLEAKGVGILGMDDRLLVTDPRTSFGALHCFTTWKPPGDPRDLGANGRPVTV